MSGAPDADDRLERLLTQAGHRCGYCRSSQRIMGVRLILDHLVPRARGGTDQEQNLWPSCQPCNGFKQARTQARDPIGGALVPLFNPRRQCWGDHFGWEEGGLIIGGRTAIGRATVAALQLNRRETGEPCLMCLGAAMACFIGAVYYGHESPSDGAVDVVRGWQRDAAAFPAYRVPTIVGGVLRAEALALFREYVERHSGGAMWEWASGIARLAGGPVPALGWPTGVAEPPS